MKVTNNVYALDCTKGAYAYLIRAEETVLVDTGFPGKGPAILKELQSLGVAPEALKHILLTHHDLDHIGNAVWLQRATGARLWASAADLPYMQGELPRPGLKRYLAALVRLNRPQTIQAFVPEGRVAGITVLAAPGHTPGHVCLLFEEVLLVGDLVENRGGRLKPLGALMTWDAAILRESIRRIARLPHAWICPAHGSPVPRGDQWQALL